MLYFFNLQKWSFRINFYIFYSCFINNHSTHWVQLCTPVSISTEKITIFLSAGHILREIYNCAETKFQPLTNRCRYNYTSNFFLPFFHHWINIFSTDFGFHPSFPLSHFQIYNYNCAIAGLLHNTLRKLYIGYNSKKLLSIVVEAVGLVVAVV